VLQEGSHSDIADRALPFREGEEVLVKIEEPHMYNEDDAVAKIDGYVISVAGGMKVIGQTKLIRIERAGRASATASLVDQNGNATSVDSDEDDDDSPEKPKRTRRGRRGGRGRAKTTGKTADEPAETAAE
jgi:ribonuclease G